MALNELLTGGLFGFFMVFCRIGGFVMLMPGVGEAYVPSRVRLVFALMMSLALSPLITPLLPRVPGSIGGLMALMGAELMVGIFFGTLARIVISAIHTAGTVIAMQSGLASAMMLDVTQTSQSTVVSNLLTVTAMTLLFAADLHHLLLTGIADSYHMFAPGDFPAPADMLQQVAARVSQAFRIALQMSSPFIVIGLILYLGGGILSRLMPTLQIFFLLMSPQIMLVFFILMIILPAIMMWYMGQLAESFGALPL